MIKNIIDWFRKEKTDYTNYGVIGLPIKRYIGCDWTRILVVLALILIIIKIIAG